jgi:AsmA protein
MYTIYLRAGEQINTFPNSRSDRRSTMKALKWLLIIGGGLVALVVAALLLIPLFVDVNKYKPEIEKQVSDATGRPFAIKGDLELSLFPWAGVSLSDLHLGSPPGFTEKDFLFVKSFDVRMKLLPLLSKDIQVQRFVIEGPRIVLEMNKDGRGNWEGLGKPGEKVTPKTVPQPGPKEPVEGLPLKSLAVGEFAVRNGSLLYLDHGSGSRKELSDLMLELKDVSLDRPVHFLLSAVMNKMPLSVEGRVGPVGKDPGKGKLPLDVSVRAFKEITMNLKGNLQDVTAVPQFDLNLAMDSFSPRKVLDAMGASFPVATADPEALSRMSLKSKITGSAQKVSLSDGILDLDESKLIFSAVAKDFSKPDLAFDLNLDKINLDRYLPPSSEKKDAAVKEGKAAEPKKTDYTPLRKMVLDGKIRVGAIIANGLKMQDIQLNVAGRNGVIRLDPLMAKLYEGTLSAKAAMDVRQDVPRSSMDFQTKSVKAGPLLQDLLKKDFLEGTADAGVSISMAGDQPEEIKKTLNGKGQLVFKDGAVKGIDLAGMVRNVTSAFRPGQAVGEKPRTDFTELIAPFTIANGVVNTDGTSLASPLVRVLATGKANIVDESLDLRVEPRFVATLKGQEDTKERSGIMVPVLVKGTFSAPSFQPDLKGMLEQQLKERTLPSPKDLLKPQEGETTSPQERLRDVLRGLPGRK